MDMTWNIASFLIDCTFHTGWRNENWVNAGKKEGVFHLAGDARHHCYIKCGTRPLRISKRGIIFPYFALSSPSKMHPAAKRVCRCCRNLSSETAALSFSERPVLVLHRHNKSTHHLRSCCGVSISVSIWIPLNDWNHKPSCQPIWMTYSIWHGWHGSIRCFRMYCNMLGKKKKKKEIKEEDRHTTCEIEISAGSLSVTAAAGRWGRIRGNGNNHCFPFFPPLF